ncbi:unnamed protein product, partial [Aphanomyces euteiches]
METPPAISNPTQDVLDDDNTNFGRSKFACRDDIILLTQVVLASPWAAGHKKIMAAWEEIAKNCKFWPEKKGIRAQNESGVPEDFEEREALLTDIKTRIDDYVEVDAARKDTDKKKKEGIETSGLMLRQLAMGEKQECFQKKRKRPSHTKAGVVEGTLSSIKEGLAVKREKDELLLAERRE